MLRSGDVAQVQELKWKAGPAAAQATTTGPAALRSTKGRGQRQGRGQGCPLGPARARPGTHRCRGDRGLAEEPLSLLELAVPPVVFAVGVPEKGRNNIVGARQGGQGQAGPPGLTSGW